MLAMSMDVSRAWFAAVMLVLVLVLVLVLGLECLVLVCGGHALIS